jgi:hypothetical protein
MHALRRSAVVAAVAAALVAPVGTAQAAPAPAKPTTPAPELLLKQGEFPAGYQVQKVSQQELSKVLRDVGADLTKARYTPANCAPVMNVGGFDRASRLPVVVAVNEGAKTAISEVLSATDNIDTAVTNPAGCDKVRVELDRIGGTDGKLVMDIASEPLALGGAPAGTKALVVRTSGTATVDGKPRRFNQEQVVAGTSVRGYAVLVTGAGAGQNAKPDRGAVAQTLTAAANKVRTAR